MPPISLSEFKALLGNVNDGNVVFTADKTGVEKANHGNVFTRHKYRQVPNSPEENRSIRQALMTAILNSEHGKALTPEQVSSIRAGLGLGKEADATRALGRDELKVALDTLEAMQRTNGIPHMRSNGTFIVAKDTPQQKNMARFNNRMIARQFALLVQKGYSEAAVEELFGKVIDLFTQAGSPYQSAEGMAKLLPKKDFHGHKTADVARFIRNNRALVESALVDRIAWKLLDGAANLPKDQEEFNFNVNKKEEFLATILDLMKDFAAKRDPVPRAVKLLAMAPAVEAPDDEVGKLAFDQFKASLTQKLAALFPKADHKTLATRQQARFRRYVETAALTLYKTTYEKTAGTAPERKTAADAALAKRFPLFMRYSADEMKALGKNNAFAEASQRAMCDAIGALPTTDGWPLVDDVERVFNKAFAALDAKMDLEPLAKACVEKAGLDGEQAEKATNALVKAMNEGGAKSAALVAGLRIQMLRAAATGEPDAVKNAATGLAATSRDFAAFADVTMKDFADPEAVKRQRTALFVSCGKVEVDSKTHRTLAQRSFESYQTQVESVNCRKDLTDDQRKAEIAKLEPYRLLGEDEVFLGKLSAVVAAQKIPPASELDQRLMPGGKFTTDLNDLQACREIIERMADELTLNELKGLEKYLQWNLSAYDIDNSINRPDHKSTFFLDLVSDGSIDFDAIPPKARSFLLDNVVGQLTRNANGYIAMRDLTPNNLPPDVVPVLYKAIRESAVKLGATQSAETQQGLLRARGVSTPEMPPDFDFHSFLNQEGDAIPTGFRAHDLLEMSGFGTTDLHKILDALVGAGLKVNELDKPENWMKMLELRVIVQANGYHLDGAIEWAERLTGKSFAEMTLADCEGLLSKTLLESTPVDPLTKLAGGRKAAVAFLSGTVKTDEAGLVAKEMPAFLAALRTLEGGAAEPQTVTLFGEQVALRRRPNGALTATFASGEKLPFAVAHSAGEIAAQIENEMTTHVSRYGAAAVTAILPPLPGEGDPIARPRELYAKVLSSALGLLPVTFAHLGTKELRQAALEALVHPEAVKTRFAKPPATYNNAEAVEMQERYLMADNVERSLVTMPPVPQARTLEERQNNLPGEATVRDLVADLFMNKDTWAFDAGNRVPGQRLETFVQTYQPELGHLRAHPELLDKLNPVARDLVKTLLQALDGVDLKSANARARFAEIEKTIDQAVDTAMATMQAKASALFVGHAQEDRPLWQQSLDEMSGVGGGINTSTAEGRFLKKVLDNYFVKCDPIEKRAMLSAMIRNTDDSASDGRQVAEMLKGAGPLLQKMLQKLSPDTFDEETKIAIKDMKSKLAPIPDTVIQAQLLELVRSSRGQILSVEVQKSIGQASVGQALLCHIRTKTHPVSGEDVVIKLLRPNVQTAVQREHELMLRIARDLDREDNSGTSQQTTFEGRYASILEEFDFTLEAENVDLGIQAYEKPTVTLTVDGERTTKTYDHVHSMNRHGAVDPRSGMLVLEKVDGEPVDRLLEKDHAEAVEALAGMTVKTALPGGPVVTTYEANSHQELLQARFDLRQKRDKAVEQRDSVVQLLDAWFERALFGDGVFHNDLHPGNVMMKDTTLTVIDFGNVMRLTKSEQSELVFVFLAAMRGKTDDFLASIDALLDAKGKSVLANIREDLRKDLGVIFAKGTSSNVLPRALAAMSLLQKRGVPIPESVHNFAQSLERLHGVIASFDAEIRDLERMSRETKFSAEFAKKFDPQHPEAQGLGVPLDVVSKIDEIFVLQGDPADGMNYPEIQKKAGALKEAFSCEIKGGLAPFDDTKELDPKTREMIVVADPMDQVEKPGVEGVGKGVAPFCAEIREKVFAAPDGGVAFLRAFAAKYSAFVDAHPKTLNGVYIADLSTVNGFSDLPQLVEDYAALLAGAPKPDDPKVAAQQKEILREMLNGIYSFASAQEGDTHYHCNCDPAAELDSFEACVGMSLAHRSDDLADTMRAHMGIDKAKFDHVMELARNGANLLAIGWAAGTDAPKFYTLKDLAKELENLGTLATNFENRMTAMTKAADAWNATLPKEDQLPLALREKLAACARDFRMPANWKPSLANAQDKAAFRDVLGVALATARAAVAPAELTENALKYFARIYAGASSLVGLAETLRKDENANWSLELQAGQNSAPTDGQLVAFVTALADPEVAIPPFPEAE